jgi:glycosyltransferase involved in cell wall biosynthesis
LSVCLDDSPVLGGLSRGIRDLSAAVGGRILSLDSGRLPPAAYDAACNLTRLRGGRDPLAARHLRLSRRTRAALEGEIVASDLVICHSLYRAHLPFVRRTCRRHGIPYWVVAHGMLDPWVVARRPAWKRAWLELYGRACLADARRVVFTTDAERLKAAAWWDGRNAVVIHWPLEPPRIDDREACRAEWRDRLHVPADTRILLWLSRYDALKRPGHTVDVFAAARRAGWHLVMAGYDGDERRADVARFARLRCGDVVHVLGPVEGEEKRRLLVASDAFVSLSWRESFGYALAEAVAAGMPFAAAPDHDLTPDMPRACRDWIATDHTPSAAVEKVAMLLGAAGGRLLESGASGRQWAYETLSAAGFREAVLAVARVDAPELASSSTRR